MSNLSGKKAVITGGNSGIGYETAKLFKAKGAEVIITGRNSEKVQIAAEELGVKGLVTDQSDLKAIERLVSEVKETFGKIDILFINAGIAAFAPFEMVTEEHLDNIMNINFKGAFFTLQKFTPILKEGASVINLSSLNAYSGMDNTVAYAASKAAMNSFTRTVAQELAPKKIRVNAVCPGPIETPIFSKMGIADADREAFAANATSKIPLKRFGKSEEVAGLVSFLASDEAAFITGSEYMIDGGLGLKTI
ncbi:SDR family oxidoreductase [Chondrinema litorale]|uniref:SDR family oxidoreductase n=1 Tax=Chondrinema litorale TaxID=2994555 RepID=UPI0025428E1E|nr:SDR family oxidoreductase [Chondrinema litorale]UZR97025.1 SDR family oxidoreductase [Chondrinema litorale]